MWLKHARWVTETGRIAGGDLRVENGLIVEVGEGPVDPADGFDCSPYVLLPGMVNAHFHHQSTLVRGQEFGLELYDWFGDSPGGRAQIRADDWLAGQATRDQLRTVTGYEYARLLRQGVTLVADAGMAEIDPTILLEAAEGVGIRALAQFYEEDGAVRPAGDFTVNIASEEDLTREAVDQAVRVKDADDPIFALHCLETVWRREHVLRTWGKSTIDVLAEFGLLGPRTVLFHACEMDDHDIETVAHTEAAVAHCPVSNLAFGGTIAPLAKWCDAGITVGLGTDWGDLDYWSTVRAAWLLGQRDADRNRRLTPADVLRMAGRGGAIAYSRPDLGEIAAGRTADLVFLDAAALGPCVEEDDVSTTAYAIVNTANAHTVRHVIVGGEFVVRDGRHTRIDFAALESEYRQLAAIANSPR